jgi:hypothetical protein
MERGRHETSVQAEAVRLMLDRIRELNSRQRGFRLKNRYIFVLVSTRQIALSISTSRSIRLLQAHNNPLPTGAPRFRG